MKIIPSRKPIRPTVKDLDYYELLESIKRDSQLVPILCRPCFDGLEIIDGNKRFQICIDLGIEPKYNVVEVDESEVVVLQLKLNNLSVKDRQAGIFRAIRENKLDKWTNVVHTLGEHSSRLYMDLGFEALDDWIWKAVKADAIHIEVARLLCKLPKKRQRELLTVALEQPVSDLVDSIGREVRQLWQGRIDRRLKRKNSPDGPYLRSQKEIYNEVIEPNETMRLITKEGIKAPYDAFQLALKWTLRLDPESVKRRTCNE